MPAPCGLIAHRMDWCSHRCWHRKVRPSTRAFYTPSGVLLVCQSSNGPGRDGPSRNGPARDGPSRDGPRRNGPKWDVPSRDEPARHGPSRNGTGLDGPIRNGPRRAGPNRDGTEQERIEPGRTDQRRTCASSCTCMAVCVTYSTRMVFCTLTGAKNTHAWYSL